MKYLKPLLRPVALVLVLGLFGMTRAMQEVFAADKDKTSTLSEVVVTGEQGQKKGSYNPTTLSLGKYTESLQDTPQSVTVIPNQVMKDQGVTTLREALRNVSGISIAAGEASSQGDNLTIRGFSARSDIYQDGMRDFGSYYRDPFNLENVEVLKGPSSIMFGRGSTGGIVNQENKTPQLKRLIAGSTSFGTDLTRRATVDLNTPLGFWASAFRLNMMVNANDLAGRKYDEFKRFGFAPSLAFGIGTPTRVVFSYFHQEEHDHPDYGIPFLFSRPAPVSRKNYYGFSDDRNFLKTKAHILTAKVEHDFTDDWTVRNQFRYADYGRHAQITEAQIPTSVTRSTPLADIRVTRNQIAVDSTETFLDNQTDLNGKFETFGLKHTVITGFEGSHETSKPKRYTFSGVPTTSLLYPNPEQAYVGISVPSTTGNGNVVSWANSFAAYLADTIKLNQYFDLMGGVRWDLVYSHFKQSVAPVLDFNRTDSMPSWKGGLVFKPVKNGSFYFDYGTSFNPSIENLSLSAATQGVAPEKTRTFEIGNKWDFFKDRLSVNGALFLDQKTNARTPDPNDPLVNTLTGEQRARGMELEVKGNLTKSWQVFAGYTFLNTKVTKSNNPLEVGNKLANVPDHTFSFWSTLELPWKFQIGGGARAMSGRNGRTTVDTTTGLVSSVPGYATFDAMIKYHLTKNIDLQFNLINIANKYYFDSIHPVHIVPGAGRTFLFSTNFEF